MNFPQFRKYKNNQSYFKISSESLFAEWKKYGKAWEKFEFEAKILPDRNYIADMLNDYEPYWDKISEAEFNRFLELAT